MNASSADALLQHASRLFHAGRFAEAILAYQKLLDVRPALPDSWFNLAIAQRRERRFNDALRSYALALDHDIRMPEEVYLQRAVIYSDDLARPDAARIELRKALARNPHYVAALLNLGNLDEDVGDRAAARAAYAQILARDPRHPLALARMAGVADLDGIGDPLIERIATLASDPRLAVADRADLGFALGGALDRLGAFDDAFAAFARANRASRASAAAAGVRYDRAAQEMLVERIVQAYPAPVLSGANAADDAPLFICGMFRSGSTLAEQILARHDRVMPGGEIDALPALIARFLSPYPEAAAATERLAVVRRAYLAEIGSRRAPGIILTDKRPDNVLHIGLIKALFPHARFIHTRRQQADNCLSIYFLHAGAVMPYATDLDDIAHHYRQQERLMRHWRALYPRDIFELDYDRLVAEPQATIAALLAFCGLPWQPDVMRHEHSTAAVRTASNWQVRRPLYRDSSGRWRNYRRHLLGIAGLASAVASP